MITEQKARELCSEHRRLTREMEKARNRDQVRLAESYENSLARIENQLQKEDITLDDYRD